MGRISVEPRKSQLHGGEAARDLEAGGVSDQEGEGFAGSHLVLDNGHFDARHGSNKKRLDRSLLTGCGHVYLHIWVGSPQRKPYPNVRAPARTGIDGQFAPCLAGPPPQIAQTHSVVTEIRVEAPAVIANIEQQRV